MAVYAILSKAFNWIKSCVDNFKEKDQDLLKRESKESLFKINSKIDPAIQSVIQDFENLNFEDNKCFNKIADDYDKKGKGDLFNNVILKERKEIIRILDGKLPDLKGQEEFRKRFGEYLLSRIRDGMSYEEELQGRLQFLKDGAKEVLSDFENLRFDFEGNKCEDPNDLVNYNDGRSADPFDKIANYYRRKKDIFLFNYVILSKQEEIMSILDKKFTNEDQKKDFESRLGRYLLRIAEGMDDAKEFLKEDGLIGFFDGHYWPDGKIEVNHYDNLSINITKPGQSLEISRLFTDKIERMERNKNEVKRAKIHSNGKRIVTIEKNDKGQRDYYFEEDAICEMEIKWNAENEEDEFVNCSIILNINSDQFEIEKATVNGEIVELKKILELTKQNKEVLMEGKDLHKFLEGYLEKDDMQSQKGEVVIPKATVPSFSFSFDSLKPGELQAGCIGGGYDLKYLSRPSTKLDRSSVDKFDPDYREWDR